MYQIDILCETRICQKMVVGYITDFEKDLSKCLFRFSLLSSVAPEYLTSADNSLPDLLIVYIFCTSFAQFEMHPV